MAALGRILQVVGWLWVAAGIAARFFDVVDLSVFPGIVLVFIARMLRTQAARRELPDLQSGDGGVTDTVEPAPVERQLNTDRQRQTEPPPLTVYTNPDPAPEPELEPEPEPEPERVGSSELLERIASAAKSGGVEPVKTDEPADEEGRTAMSSEEMIARAHKRWDKSR